MKEPVVQGLSTQESRRVTTFRVFVFSASTERIFARQQGIRRDAYCDEYLFGTLVSLHVYVGALCNGQDLMTVNHYIISGGLRFLVSI